MQADTEPEQPAPRAVEPRQTGSVLSPPGRDGSRDPAGARRLLALQRGLLASRTFRALGSYNYRLFISGQLVSQCGTWLQRTAQAWLVLDLTGSPVALGLVAALQTLPILLLSLFGGVVADRVPKRRFLMLLLAGETAQAAVLALLTLSGHVQVWQIGVLAFVLGVLTALESPTRQALVSELVEPDQVQSAVSLNSSIFNAARIVGPGLGGVIIAVWGTGICFALNAASFLATLTGLFLMRPELLRASRRPARAAVWTQLADGLRYVARTPALAFPVVLLAFLGTFGYNFTVTLPLLARFTLDVGSVGFGSLNAAMGVGSLVGALGVAARVAPTRRNVLWAAAGFSLLFLLLALSRWYLVSLAILVVLGLLSVQYSALTNTSLQLGSREEYRGRVLSLYLLLFAGTSPIGGAITGGLADLWGIQVALGLEAVVCLLVVAGGFVYLCWAWRREAASV
jgi:MFS family permease